MIRSVLKAAVIAVSCTARIAAATADSVAIDVLDRPSAPSTLAAKKLLLSVFCRARKAK